MKSLYRIILRSCLTLMIFVRYTTVAIDPDFYYISDVSKTWEESKFDCENRGMELAMLDTEKKYNAVQKGISLENNDEENTYSYSYSDTVTSFWIGLSLDTTCTYPPYVYRYVNRLSPTYWPWGMGQPSFQSYRKCVVLYKSRWGSGFMTGKCSNSKRFICTALTADHITQHPLTTEFCDTTSTQSDQISVPETDSSTQQQTTTTTKDGTTVPDNDRTDKTNQQINTTITTEYNISITHHASHFNVVENVNTTGFLNGTLVVRNEGHRHPECLCPCSSFTNKWLFLMGNNYTRAQIEEIMKAELIEIKDRLKVNYKTTSRYIRSITSANDSRGTSFTMGIVGVSVIGSIVGLILLIDCSRVGKFCCSQLYDRRRNNIVGMAEI